MCLFHHAKWHSCLTHSVTQLTTAPAPAWTAWQSASETQSATSTWCPFCRRAQWGRAMKAAAVKPPLSSTAACRSAWPRCWSCASVRRQTRAVRRWRGHCKEVRAATRPGPARIQWSSAQRRRAAGEPTGRVVCNELVIKNVRSGNQCCPRCYLVCCVVACGHVCHSRGQRASVLVPPQNNSSYWLSYFFNFAIFFEKYLKKKKRINITLDDNNKLQGKKVMLCSGLGAAPSTAISVWPEVIIKAITVSLCRHIEYRTHVRINDAIMTCNNEVSIWRVLRIYGHVYCDIIRPEWLGYRWCISSLHPVMLRKTQPGKTVAPSRPTREKLKIFQTKCWSFGEDEGCGQGDPSQDGCLGLMDPELLLGEEPECKMALVATLGTVLHHPCSCNGVHNDHVLTCNKIHEVLHNRSLFSEYGLNLIDAIKKKTKPFTSTGPKLIQQSSPCVICILVTPWQRSSGPVKPPQMDESGQNPTWPHNKFPGVVDTFAACTPFNFYVSLSVCEAPWTALNRFESCHIITLNEGVI